MKFGCLSEKIITNGQFWESLILGTLIQTKTWSSCFGSISKFPTVCHLDSFVHGVGVCLRRTDVGPPVLQPHPLHLQHRARLLCSAGGQVAALESRVRVLCRAADTLFIPSEWMYFILSQHLYGLLSGRLGGSLLSVFVRWLLQTKRILASGGISFES